MVDIITDFSSVDEDWHYLALIDDVRPGVDLSPELRVIAGSDDERWTVEIIDVRDDLVRFKLVERVPVREDAHNQAG